MNLYYFLRSLIQVSLFLLIISCSENPRASVFIEDASIPFSKELYVDLDERRYVNKLHLHIKGQINDTARIGNRFLYPGKIDKMINLGDHYSSEYTLDYDPLNVTEGYLDIEVEFIII